MKTKLFITAISVLFAANMVTANVNHTTLTGDSLKGNSAYFLDGKLVSNDVMLKVDPNDIESMSITKEAHTIDGVQYDSMTFVTSKKKSLSMITPVVVGATETTIIYLDGKQITKDEMAAINPDNIESISVMKGSPIIDGTKYDSMILVTTKKAAKTAEVSSVTFANDNTVIYLDGKQITKDEMAAISPDNIESITVLKGSPVIDGVTHNGSVLITTKK